MPDLEIEETDQLARLTGVNMERMTRDQLRRDVGRQMLLRGCCNRWSSSGRGRSSTRAMRTSKGSTCSPPRPYKPDGNRVRNWTSVVRASTHTLVIISAERSLFWMMGD